MGREGVYTNTVSFLCFPADVTTEGSRRCETDGRVQQLHTHTHILHIPRTPFAKQTRWPAFPCKFGPQFTTELSHPTSHTKNNNRPCYSPWYALLLLGIWAMVSSERSTTSSPRDLRYAAISRARVDLPVHGLPHITNRGIPLKIRIKKPKRNII
jgi:hypothetical protein